MNFCLDNLKQENKLMNFESFKENGECNMVSRIKKERLLAKHDTCFSYSKNRLWKHLQKVSVNKYRCIPYTPTSMNLIWSSMSEASAKILILLIDET